jgi:3-dehydroquinate dehydratase/shikimate dehydrogenase
LELKRRPDISIPVSVSKPARVCIPLCEPNLIALQSADLIEWRIDCFERELTDLSAFLNNISVPVIVTFRPAEQGGYRKLTREERKAFWRTQAPRGEGVWWDVEADIAEQVAPEWSSTIVSHHDFKGVPNDLDQIYGQLSQTPARVLKLAVQANDVVDCIPVFELIDRARSEGREIIAIAMGNAGIATRILGPSRGSFLTYGALDEESATAPGQVNARSLRSVYHIDTIDEETMICGLVGMPAMHSVSPHMHNAAFMSEGINGVYLPFEVKDVDAFFKRMVHPRTREIDWNLRGLSITAPHKETVMNCIDWIDPDAQAIGAVNTIIVEKDHLRGYNTDTTGFMHPLRGLIDSYEDLEVAVIGAGGAARAAIWALKRYGATVTLFARDPRKAQSLAEFFSIECRQLGSASFSSFEVVVNATPLGSGQYVDQTPATRDQLKGTRIAFDMVYNPMETKFLQEARIAGCETVLGLEMLVGQARTQFELWSDRKFLGSSIMYEAAAAALT